MTYLQLLSRFFLAILSILLIISIYKGITTLPFEGDSINYHIPIAQNIISGNFITQKNIVNIERWYPGASEIILSFFILLGIPLNLFNILAIIIFAIVLYKLGMMFIKNKELSIIYSMSIVTLYGVFRLANTQNIDIWFAIYFILLLMFLEKPKDSLFYYLKLGLFSGLLIGSKYTGPIFFIILTIFYLKSFLHHINIKNLIIFLIPFSIFGLFWYIRNWLITGSPVYPQSILFLKGLEGWHSYLEVPMWQAFIKTPFMMVNAYISELMFWPILFLGIPIFIYLLKKKKNVKPIPSLNKILFIPIFCFIIYLFFPYDNKYEGMVLSIRYIFSTIALLSLVVFVLAEKLKIDKIISTLLVTSVMPVFLNPYRPKMIYFYEPFVFLLSFYAMFKNKLKIKISKHL